MLLIELFDYSAKFKRSSDKGALWKYQFKINDIGINVFVMLKPIDTKYAKNYYSNLDPNSDSYTSGIDLLELYKKYGYCVELSFKQFKQKGYEKKDSKGNNFKIFSTVFHIITDLTKSMKIVELTVAAETADASRVDLYRKLTETLPHSIGFKLDKEYTYGKYTKFSMYNASV